MPTIQLTNAPFIDKNFIVTGAFGEIRSGGRVHRGLDLAPYGYAGDLYAIDHFKLMYKGYDADGYGNYAIFTNENNMMYLYAHMSSLPSKNIGDVYNIHEYIAPAGTTGSSTGVHLHLEMQTGTSWQYSQPITRYTNPCDYLIGIIIGLCVLTKQSVGGALALVSVYYLFKDYKKFFKRVAGAFIPVVIFLIYIFIVDCYKEFFDLCIAGLFDFGKENYVGNIFIILCYLLCLGVVIYKIIKDKRNINNYYVLALSIMVIPMFDYFHLKFFVLGVLILFIEKISLKRLNLDLLFSNSSVSITSLK